jgi:Mg/Co/Ni transporter MgtE
MDNAFRTGKESLGAIRYVFIREVFKRNALLAVLVGCLLTLTNQLDVLLGQPFSLRLGTKIFFNFLIPFVVSSASAVINRECY